MSHRTTAHASPSPVSKRLQTKVHIWPGHIRVTVATAELCRVHQTVETHIDGRCIKCRRLVNAE